MHFAAQMPLADGDTRLDESRHEYGAPSESKLITDDSAVKAALDAFNGRWPWTLSRQELTEVVQARITSAGIDANGTRDRDALMDALLAFARDGSIFF